MSSVWVGCESYTRYTCWLPLSALTDHRDAAAAGNQVENDSADSEEPVDFMLISPLRLQTSVGVGVCVDVRLVMCVCMCVRVHVVECCVRLHVCLRFFLCVSKSRQLMTPSLNSAGNQN